MTVAVIGLGSMGKRRIRLIKQYDRNIKIVGIDLNKERCASVQKEHEIIISDSISAAKMDHGVSAVFISTSPISHFKIIQECLKYNLHVFTELNLISDGYQENLALAKKNDCCLFLSSTFLYRDEVGYIKNIVNDTDKKLSYKYHVGQYLPDWHPWESYKNFFVANKRTNGCREIFAIELPWLIETFGEIKTVKVFKNKITDLDIDYNDNYLVIIEHASGHSGTLSVNVVSRKAVRDFQLYGEDVFLTWDGSPTGLYKYNIDEKVNNNIVLYDNIDKLSEYSSNIIENAYYNEINNFFDSIAGKDIPRYSFEKDEKVLNMIDKIEGEDN